MKAFERGVSYFTKSTVEITFPEDDIVCHWCPLLGSEYKPDREYCRKTGEYLLAPKYTVGERCPLKFEQTELERGTK